MPSRHCGLTGTPTPRDADVHIVRLVLRRAVRYRDGESHRIRRPGDRAGRSDTRTRLGVGFRRSPRAGREQPLRNPRRKGGVRTSCPAHPGEQLADVAAHYALTSMFEDVEDETEVRAFAVTRADHRSDTSGVWQLGAGRVRVTSRITREREEMIYGVLHFGDHNLAAGVGPARKGRRYPDVVERVFAPFEQGDAALSKRKLC
ncbi:MAG: DUF3536 domain-containing protein [Trueperaceae bacterium]|nr:DUF3536 domain-containing protein [Trueperaceae bacterium]